MSPIEPEKISAWLDGELDEAERAEVEGALEASAELRRLAEEEREAKQALARLPPVEPRADLELRVRRRVLEEARPSRLRFWITLAAALLVGALWLRGTPEFVVLELAHDHRKCFSLSRLPAEVWSSDMGTVESWFAGQGTELPRLPDQVGEVSLVGGRYCPLLGASMAPHLYYAGEDLQLSVFLVPRSVRFEDGYGAVNGDVAVRLLRVDGAVVGVASDRAREVERFRRRLEAAGRTAALEGAASRLTAPGAAATIIVPPRRGAVAQLGARVNGIHEVTGSIPVSSTNPSSDLAR